MFDTGRNILALCGRNGVGKTTILKSIEWIAHSAIAVEYIALGPVGNWGRSAGDPLICLDMDLDGIKYRYQLSPGMTPDSSRNPATNSPSIFVLDLTEHLYVNTKENRPQMLFERKGETITAEGVDGPVRISRFVTTLAALRSLLPPDHPLLGTIERITSFLAGVHYYPLGDQGEDEDHVQETSYRDWLIRRDAEGALTESVNLRLIHMWLEDRPKFEEWSSIVGPSGLGLIEKFHIGMVELPNIANDGWEAGTRIFSPVFLPGRNMGGAGGSYGFSRLSAGTRRVLQIITSMLFDEQSLMLIEQPEDSIHPGLLRKLIEILRIHSGGNQVLFSTHSSAVLDVLEPEEILLVTAEGGATKVRNLSSTEVEHARWFLDEEGSMSEFIETLERS